MGLSIMNAVPWFAVLLRKHKLAGVYKMKHQLTMAAN